MSVVAARIYSDHAIIAADTAAFYSDGRRSYYPNKIHTFTPKHLPQFAIGFCGSVAFGEFLRKQKTRVFDERDMETLVDHLMDDIRSWAAVSFSHVGHDKADAYSDFEALVVSRDEMYALDHQSAAKVEFCGGRYMAIGAGARYALGAMYVRADISPTFAVLAACAHDASCYCYDGLEQQVRLS